MTTALWSRQSWAPWPALRTRSRSSRRGLLLHPPRRGGGVCHQDRLRLPGHCHRHQPRRIQVQRPSSAPATRRASWFRLPCASTCWRRSPSACPASPSCCTVLLPCPRSIVKMINENGGKMPDAIGIPEDQLRQAARAVRLQDQHRLRPASGHDRHHPPVLRRASRQV